MVRLQDRHIFYKRARSWNERSEASVKTKKYPREDARLGVSCCFAVYFMFDFFFFCKLCRAGESKRKGTGKGKKGKGKPGVQGRNKKPTGKSGRKSGKKKTKI